MTLKQDFYNTITRKHRVLPFYKALSFKHNNHSLFSSKDHNDSGKFETPVNATLFPSYLNPEFYKRNDIKVVKIPQKKIIGYSVLTNQHQDIDSHLKTEYKKSFRSNILRFVNRFESCFNVTYKMFSGEISEEEYKFLMDTLHDMLTNRFNQRNESNKVLKNWEEYLKNSYTSIKEKKASLFVIYHNTTPVHICLNHHFGKILFVSVPSYDTNYSKFALGNISLYKLLEWCINNNYELMDMAYGYLEYKRRWSNNIYSFDHHIVYKKNNIWNKISAAIEIKKLQLKNVLKDRDFDDRFQKIKSYLHKSNTFAEPSFSFENTESLNDLDKYNLVNENSDSFSLIQKPINEFLFINKVHIDSLKIYEISKRQEYILNSDAKVSQKLTLH